MDHQYGSLDLPPIPVSAGWQPRITPATYVGVQFAMMGLAIVVAAVRTSVRVYNFRRVTIDDVLLVIAMLAHVAAVVIAYHATGLVYWTVYINMGLMRPMGNYVDMMKAFSILDNLSNIFAWGSLYLVKISFLVFLRSLTNRVRIINIYWWIIFVLILMMTPVTMFLGFYICPDFSDNMANTCGRYVVIRQWTFLVVNCCLDIISDVLILTIPVWLLWKVQIGLARKFALGAVLCLSIFMVVLALIRVTLDNIPVADGSMMPDTPWLYFWTNIEGSVAILMVSLTAFRSMLGQNQQRSGYYGSHTNSTAHTHSGTWKTRSNRWSGAPMSQAGVPASKSIDMHEPKQKSLHDDASDSDETLLPPLPASARRGHVAHNTQSVPLSPIARSSADTPRSPVAPMVTPYRADQLPRIATSAATPTSPLSASLAGPLGDMSSHRSSSYGSASPRIPSAPVSVYSAAASIGRSRPVGARIPPPPQPPMSPPMSPTLSAAALERGSSPGQHPNRLSSLRRPSTPGGSMRTQSKPAVGYVDPALSAIRKEITIRTSFEAAPGALAPADAASLSPLVSAHSLHDQLYEVQDSSPYYVEENARDCKEVGMDVV